MNPDKATNPLEATPPSEENVFQKSDRVSDTRQKVFDDFTTSFSKENEVIITDAIKKQVYTSFKEGFYDGKDQTAPAQDDFEGAEQYAKELFAKALREAEENAKEKGTIDPKAKINEAERNFEAYVLQDIKAVLGRDLDTDEYDSALQAYKTINSKEGYAGEPLKYIMEAMSKNKGNTNNPAIDA